VATPPDPFALLRTKRYVVLLALAAVLGIPISVVAYWFLELVDWSQREVFTNLPRALGFAHAPVWWPLPWLAVAGALVALTVRFLPGTGGHRPAEGFKPGGTPEPSELPGVALASLATLAFGAVLGPEAPLIAIGGGLAACVPRFARRDSPAATVAVVAAVGSFAAISTLLGSPILAAFLLMEATGLGGPMLEMVLLPGLLAAGLGALVFVGLDAWTGFGTFSLALPNLPHFARPDIAEFGWALGIGVGAALAGTAIRWLALSLQPRVERRMLLSTPVVGLAVALLAIAFGQFSSHSASEVLFSGQTALPSLVAQSATYSAAALALLFLCKGLAYALSLSAFRGGPVFPSMFVGAAGGIALSHLPGLPLVPGVAMGIGAMCAVMLRFPITSVMLATLLLAVDGLAVMPLVIVAVVVAYVLSARLSPTVPGVASAGETAAPAASGAPARVPVGAPGS